MLTYCLWNVVFCWWNVDFLKKMLIFHFIFCRCHQLAWSAELCLICMLNKKLCESRVAASGHVCDKMQPFDGKCETECETKNKSGVPSDMIRPSVVTPSRKCATSRPPRPPARPPVGSTAATLASNTRPNTREEAPQNSCLLLERFEFYDCKRVLPI